MTDDDLGTWEPLDLQQLATVFQGAPFRWWITGGHALELFVGASWRRHDDIDVGIRRIDAPRLHVWLADWDVMIGAGGVLSPWDGRPLDAARNENNLWARRGPGEPWAFDVAVGDGDDDRWIFRRDRSLTIPWEVALRSTDDGLAYLAPAIQLLFKSQDPRPKDELDAAAVIPLLTTPDWAWLLGHLDRDHPWRSLR